MPYKSDAQRKFMHAKHPEIAKRWDKEAKKKGKGSGPKKGQALPAKVAKPVKGKSRRGR